MITYGWPDIIIVLASAISGVRGWKLGFINELAGTIAVVTALAAALGYPGSWDSFLVYWMRLHPDSAHVVAMFLCGLLAYGLVAGLAMLLNRYSATSVVKPVNACGGALLGAFKALMLFWLIIYIALFLPLSHSLRADLRSSFLVMMMQSQSRQLDDKIRPATPWFARPFISPYLRRHHL